MSLSPIPVADAAMDTDDKNRCSPDPNKSSNGMLDESIAQGLWDEMEKDCPMIPPFDPKTAPSIFGTSSRSHEERLWSRIL